jgi:uncharacterized protein YbaR (Trm112 family)
VADFRLEPWLREILVCPQCHSALRDDETTGELVCTSATCGLAYPVVDGIPILLVDDARPTRSAGSTGSDSGAPS